VKRFLIVTMLLALCSTFASAREEGRSLTLKEAIRLAVENNLDVRAELYNPAAAQADLGSARGIYNPLLFLQSEYRNSNTLSPNRTIVGGAAVARQRSITYDAGVSQLVPTGGTLEAAFNNGWNDNNFGLGKYYGSDVTLSFVQPLLKNFGRESTNLNIDVAGFNREGALEQFRTRLMDIVSQVQTQYHQLYSARENLEVKRASLNLAETILTNTKAQVKAGVLPAMEILNAEFGVATQKKGVIDAERALSDQVDQLRLLLQIHDARDIIPVDTPFRDDYRVDESGAIKRALETRPELRQQRISLKSSELQSRVARNQTLPDLNFNASAAFTGLSDRYSRDLERVGSGRYPIWIAGLKLTYPIGNDSAENEYIKSKLKLEQTRTQINGLEETVSTNVRSAIRAVRSGYLQLDVTARGRAYAEEVMEAYIKRQKVGLATTKDLLDVLNNLVAARGNEILAVVDYNNAIVALWKTTGELLEREGITLGGKEAEALYEKNR
jgi:outer membrane protein TolC